MCDYRSIKQIEAKAAQNGRKSPFYKMMYEDLMTDPLGEAKKMYKYFNIIFTEDTQQRLLKYIKNDPNHPKKSKHGPHKYSISEFAITEEKLGREFADYNAYMSLLQC